MEIRRAVPADTDGVIALIAERIRWMDEAGIEQWNKTQYMLRYPRDYWEEQIRGGFFFVAEEDGRITGVMALYPEDERWPEDGVSAFYVHHLASACGAPGTGRKLLLWAEGYSRQEGKAYLRLDSAVGNEGLARFYGSLGYTEAGLCTDGPYHGICREKNLQQRDI